MSSPSAAGCEIRNFGVKRPLNIWLLKGKAGGGSGCAQDLSPKRKGVFGRLLGFGHCWATDRPKRKDRLLRNGVKKGRKWSRLLLLFPPPPVFFLLSILHVSAQCVREEEEGRGVFLLSLPFFSLFQLGPVFAQKGEGGKVEEGMRN